MSRRRTARRVSSAGRIVSGNHAPTCLRLHERDPNAAPPTLICHEINL
jgi:hypothetical protein